MAQPGGMDGRPWHGGAACGHGYDRLGALRCPARQRLLRSCCCRSTCCAASGRRCARSAASAPTWCWAWGYITFPGGMMAVARASARGARAELGRRPANRCSRGVADRVVTGFPRRAGKGMDGATRCAPRSPRCRRRPNAWPDAGLLRAGGGRQPGRCGAQRDDAAARWRLPESSARRWCIRLANASRSTRRPTRGEGECALHRRHGGAYASADLVICRAGALTVAELAAVGVASLLGALPHAVDDHQTGNADSCLARRRRRRCPQSELTPQRLAGSCQSDRGACCTWPRRRGAVRKPPPRVAVTPADAADLGGPTGQT